MLYKYTSSVSVSLYLLRSKTSLSFETYSPVQVEPTFRWNTFSKKGLKAKSSGERNLIRQVVFNTDNIECLETVSGK